MKKANSRFFYLSIISKIWPVSTKRHALFFLLIVIFTSSYSQEGYQPWLDANADLSVINWKIKCYMVIENGHNAIYTNEEKNSARSLLVTLKNEKKAMEERYAAKYTGPEFQNIKKKWYELPSFHSQEECMRYKSDLWKNAEAKRLKGNKLEVISSNEKDSKKRWDPAKSSIVREKTILHNEQSILVSKWGKCDCENIEYGSDNSVNNNIESEFLAEIAKINTDIARINSLASNRELEKSLVRCQILCDKIRLLQGRQYFSSTLKKIRRENPGFTFTITPLADQVTRDYWIRMRNRANLSYRKAMDAYSGCVYNEGIQQAGYIEIPYGFAKATYDLVTNWQDMISGSLFGTFTAIKQNAIKGDYAIRRLNVVGEDIIKAGGDAYDWKSYVGVLGGFISAFDGYVKTYDIIVENNKQGDLLIMNRQSAQQLIKSNRLLLQEFDRYRAFIESKSSSIDCLNDKIMRLDLDNISIKGNKITIWGTGNFDWDGDEYISMIKEAGEDLKYEYIYCEDFIKALQIAVNLATTDYYTMEEKVKNSGADQTQITAQLSYNEENGAWFEQESLRLSEYYSKFCDNSTYPEDVVVVSTQVVPGVEEQDGNPDEPPVWENNTEENYNNYEEPHYDESVGHEPEYDPHHSGGSGAGVISSGNGWSAQKTSTNQADLQNDITSAVNSGKTPAGIYVGDDGEVVVYYIDDNPLGMTSWNLEWYTDVESLQNGINSNLEHGYFPMGISFTENGKFYVLYILSELQATAWQLVESELDLNYVSNNVQPYIYEKYIPVGISIYNGLYYTLLAQVPDSESVSWTIEGYEDNDYYIQQNINEKVNLGLVPFGYLKEQGVVNVLYIGF